jgi:hypothetical protein
LLATQVDPRLSLPQMRSVRGRVLSWIRLAAVDSDVDQRVAWISLPHEKLRERFRPHVAVSRWIILLVEGLAGAAVDVLPVDEHRYPRHIAQNRMFDTRNGFADYHG